MGLVLAQSATNPNTGDSLAGRYLRIRDIQINLGAKSALVEIDIYASHDDRMSNKAPVWDSLMASFTEGLFDAHFGAAPVTVSPPPATVGGILWTQAYSALQSHPATSPLVAGAEVL